MKIGLGSRSAGTPVVISATAPADPAQGQQWVDTARNLLLINTGTPITPIWLGTPLTDYTDAPVVTEFSWFRLNITATRDNGSELRVAEWILRSAVGGPQIATGGTASSTPPGATSNFLAPKAFDADESTAWIIGQDAGQLVYQLPSPARVVEYAITSHASGAYAPAAWTLEGSNDGVSWTVLDTRSGETYSAAYQTKTYAVP